MFKGSNGGGDGRYRSAGMGGYGSGGYRGNAGGAWQGGGGGDGGTPQSWGNSNPARGNQGIRGDGWGNLQQPSNYDKLLIN